MALKLTDLDRIALNHAYSECVRHNKAVDDGTIYSPATWLVSDERMTLLKSLLSDLGYYFEWWYADCDPTEYSKVQDFKLYRKRDDGTGYVQKLLYPPKNSHDVNPFRS